MVYRLISNGILSNTYKILTNDQVIVELHFHPLNFNNKTTLVLNGKEYAISKNGLFSRHYSMISDFDRVVIEGKKRSFFRDDYEIEYRGRYFRLHKKMVSSNFKIYENDRLIGSIVKESLFSDNLICEIESEPSLEVIVFIIWLALITNKRDESGTSASSEAGGMQ